MGRLRQLVCYVLYQGFAKHLPVSYSRLSLGARSIRGTLARGIISRAGKNINIERCASFSRRLEIGDNSMLGIRCQAQGPVRIGSNVLMGPDVLIYTRNHRHDRTDIPMNRQGYEDYKPVQIEDDVWVGARAIILPGVTIGTGAIIGAGAVVSRSVEPYTIAAGNPARVMKKRLPPRTE